MPVPTDKLHRSIKDGERFRRLPKHGAPKLLNASAHQCLAEVSRRAAWDWTRLDQLVQALRENIRHDLSFPYLCPEPVLVT